MATSTLPPYETPTCTRFEATSDDDMGGVSEEDVHTFATESFGSVASPYLSPFVNRRGVLDIDYGLRNEGDKSFIGNSDVTVGENSDLYIKDKHFIGTPGLWELLTRESVNKKLVKKDDLMQYKSILNLTSAHLEGYRAHLEGTPVRISRRTTFKIDKILSTSVRRGIREYLVRWKGYGPDFDRWVNAASVKNI